MNKINTWVKNIISKSFENIVVYFTTKALRYIVIFVIIAIILYWDKLVEFLDYNIKMWVIIFIALFVLALSKIYNYRKSKSIDIFIKYGMEWHANINKNKVNSIDGPFCSPCKFKMTSMPLHCSICDTEYPALNANNIENAIEKVQSIIEAELRGGKILFIDWSTGASSYPNGHFNLKNHGVSTVKDISIEITLETDDEIRDIGTYKIEKIEPDKNQRIEKSDPLRKVHNYLKEFELIDIESIDLTHEEVDELGNFHEIPDYFEWVTIKRKFSCNLKLNVNYSLRDKRKNQQNKYILEFEYVGPDNGYSYQEGETNCKIIMSEIK